MLKNDNYSKTLKKKLLNYEFYLYEHKDPAKREIKLTKDQANQLR